MIQWILPVNLLLYLATRMVEFVATVMLAVCGARRMLHSSYTYDDIRGAFGFQFRSPLYFR